MQADAAAQREEAARVRERELQERVQRQCEVLAMAEGKHQQQSAEQGARQQEQHDASLQRVRDAAPAQGHQQRLEALQAQLDAQVLTHALLAVCTSFACRVFHAVFVLAVPPRDELSLERMFSRSLCHVLASSAFVEHGKALLCRPMLTRCRLGSSRMKWSWLRSSRSKGWAS